MLLLLWYFHARQFLISFQLVVIPRRGLHKACSVGKGESGCHIGIVVFFAAHIKAPFFILVWDR